MSPPTDRRRPDRRPVAAAAVTVAVAAAATVAPAVWAFDADRFTSGAWWTPFTWPFAHLTVGHLAFTAVPAAAAGVVYAHRNGPAASAAVAAAGWVAATAAVAVYADQPVAGSSGILAAYAAAFAVVGPRRALAAVAVIWLAAAGLTDGVSAAAHLAGIAAGLGVGLRHLLRQRTAADPAAAPTGAPP